MLKLKNTLSGEIELFKPIKLGEVGMYSCGPTVYDFIHVGSFRVYITADLLRRALERNGDKVNQVINITDVGHLVSDADEGEDKIEKQAAKESKGVEEVTGPVIDKFMVDLQKLGIDVSEINFPKASENIKEQIEMIKALEEKDYTYQTSDGVYFDSFKFKDYGKLGGIDIKGLKEGARVKINKEKRNQTDFALWKFSGNKKRLQEWESPWGKGYPGWHLECSAMSQKYLGEHFDIHTGGIDLVGTHHNNEIAQSESASGKPFVNYWVHSNHITLLGEKISKSLDNSIFVEDLIEKGINPMSYKYWLYQANYSTLVNFTWESIKASQKALYKMYNFLNETKGSGNIIDKFNEEFTEAINDNLNTAKAVSVIWEMLGDSKYSDEDKKTTLLEFDKVLNLQFDNPQTKDEIPENILDLARKRQDYREKGNFEKSDELREEIYKKGFEIKDEDKSFKIRRKI
jgi:cysteinyl-tRNA synthetase